VPIEEYTPDKLYCKLLPDVLVKGGDYTEDQVAGGECVKANGGHVQILDFLDGHSTSALIAKIKEEH
jgi:D-beta-D-heptose 7-phosphate kinase/D-beta-D-heptose 1-phosphate adenosyltransferase